MEKEILMKVYILFMKVKNQLLMLSINFSIKKRLPIVLTQIKALHFQDYFEYIVKNIKK